MHRPAPRHDENEIEADIVILKLRMARQPEIGRTTYALAQPRCHGSFTVLERRAPLYLDEGNPARSSRDEIDLSCGRLVATRENAMAFDDQVSGSERLGCETAAIPAAE